MDTSEYIALAGLIVAIVFGLPIAFAFLLELRKRSAVAEIEAKIDGIKRSLSVSEIGQVTAMSCLNVLVETAMVHRAVFEEAIGAGNDGLTRAAPIFSEQRIRLMKAIYHAGLAQPDEQTALSSSWALATEWGDFDTVDLMAKLESCRRPESLPVFLFHKQLLLNRLKFKT